jgi:hypothetical protein
MMVKASKATSTSSLFIETDKDGKPQASLFSSSGVLIFENPASGWPVSIRLALPLFLFSSCIVIARCSPQFGSVDQGIDELTRSVGSKRHVIYCCMTKRSRDSFHGLFHFP